MSAKGNFKFNLKENFNQYKWEIIWLFYFLSLIFYLFCSYHYMETIWLQTGIIIFTVIAMIVIMLQNIDQIRKSTFLQIQALKESTENQIQIYQKLTDDHINTIRKSTEEQIITIQNTSKNQIDNIKESTEAQINAINESTKKQIQTFAEQTKGIIDRLEKVAGVLATVSEQNAKQLQIEEEKKKQKEEELRMLKIEQERKIRQDLNEKERLKPKISIRIDTQSYYLFWNHFWIYFINNGGDSKNMKLKIKFLSSYNGIKKTINKRYPQVNIDQQYKFDCGNIDKYRRFDLLKVSCSTRDVKDRRYFGKVKFWIDDSDWFEIELEEE